MFHICRSQDLFLWLPYICITFSLLGCCWVTEILCSLREQNSLFLYNLCLLGRHYPLLFLSFTCNITYLAPIAYFACALSFLCAHTKIIYCLVLHFQDNSGTCSSNIKKWKQWWGWRRRRRKWNEKRWWIQISRQVCRVGSISYHLLSCTAVGFSLHVHPVLEERRVQWCIIVHSISVQLVLLHFSFTT